MQQQGGAPNGPNYGGGNPRVNPNGGYGAGSLREGPIRPEDFQGAYTNAMRSLQQMQQELKDDPGALRDIQGLMRELRNLDPFSGSNDPLLAERINSALAGVEQVEMELRRKVEDAGGGNGTVRSPGGEKIPQGWEGSVAEYFRRLSKSK